MQRRNPFQLGPLPTRWLLFNTNTGASASFVSRAFCPTTRIYSGHALSGAILLRHHGEISVKLNSNNTARPVRARHLFGEFWSNIYCACSRCKANTKGTRSREVLPLQFLKTWDRLLYLYCCPCLVLLLLIARGKRFSLVRSASWAWCSRACVLFNASTTGQIETSRSWFALCVIVNSRFMVVYCTYSLFYCSWENRCSLISNLGINV